MEKKEIPECDKPFYDAMEKIATEHADYLRRFSYIMTKLSKKAKSLHTLDTNACNCELTPRQNTRVCNLLVEASTLANELGFNLFHQSDPRGASLYLIPKNWDNEKIRSQYPDGIMIEY